MFHVGQIVRCVDDQSRSDIGWDGLIKRDRLYEIRWVGKYNNLAVNEEYLGVRLVGVIRPYLRDTAYIATRFAPLDDSKLEVFRKILADLPKESETV